ncbi:MAG: FecR domain-containing protein [Chitinophagaceae bacterium]|nr:FecR domain-containing protein [Chitinophagaceae bacterium]
MAKQQRPHAVIWTAVILVIITGLALFFLFSKHKAPVASSFEDTTFIYTPPDRTEHIPRPSQVLTFSDGTRVLLIGSSSVHPLPGFPGKREVKVDGDMFFEVHGGREPLVVRSRLLVLTVTGKATFRVNAYEKENGEEVQVLSGNIHVKKAYKSQFDEPETLTDNQMVMINITIDLMEKEKLDTKDLRTWRDTVQLATLPGGG